MMKRIIWLILITLLAVPALAQDDGDGGGGFGGGGFGGGFDDGESSGIDGPAIAHRAPEVDPLADVRTWLAKAGAPPLEKKQEKPLKKLYEREVKLMAQSFQKQFGISLESALAADRAP